MFIFKLWCHLDLWSFVKVVKVNYVLPTCYFAIDFKISFLQIILNIFQQVGRVLGHKYLFVTIFYVWIVKGDIFHLMEKASIILPLITN